MAIFPVGVLVVWTLLILIFIFFGKASNIKSNLICCSIVTIHFLYSSIANAALNVLICNEMDGNEYL